jgi:hypothetical protein
VVAEPLLGSPMARHSERWRPLARSAAAIQ